LGTCFPAPARELANSSILRELWVRRPTLAFMTISLHDLAVFTVVPHRGGWAVEHEGGYLDPGRNREEVIASASKRARAAIVEGRRAQVVLKGEPRSFSGPAGSSLEWH
jgi:hypothetical protein